MDANSAGSADVAEFGVNSDYFNKPFRKLLSDFKHCLRLAPQCRRMFLMSSRVSGPKNFTLLNDTAAKWGARLKKEIFVLDGRWLATYIVDHILEPLDVPTFELLESHLGYLSQIKIEFAFSHDLPTLPKTNWTREIPTKEIISLLAQHQYVQIHGLSGMGKTNPALQLFLNRSLRLEKLQFSFYWT